jgi:hypothetical protein
MSTHHLPLALLQQLCGCGAQLDSPVVPLFVNSGQRIGDSCDLTYIRRRFYIDEGFV